MSISKVAVITTVDHNVGDDFVREGILFLLEKKLGQFEPLLIHKHVPITVRQRLDWVYRTGMASFADRIPQLGSRRLSKLLDLLPLNPQKDKILLSDLLVQSGAPVYWVLPSGSGAHTNEWYEPFIRRRYQNISSRVPFINLGAGTCQPYYSDGSEFAGNSQVSDYICDLYDKCLVTTVRDTLSNKVLAGYGRHAPVIPCPSIFGRDRLQIAPKRPEYIAMNFMQVGGHYDFDQPIDPDKWGRTFASFYRTMSNEQAVVISCHNEKELREVRAILPEAKVFIAKTAQEYLDFYSGASCYVGNRVHAAFATASFGRPGFIIGSDTRALMAAQIGLESIFVEEVTEDILVAKSRELLADDTYSDRFAQIKEQAFQDYQEALTPLTEELVTEDDQGVL